MHQEIWLMRHGDYHFDRGSLTEIGVGQIRRAAAIFKDKRIVIYHSPVLRCVETATILQEEVVRAECHPLLWLGKFGRLPENCLADLRGATIVIVSHQPTLHRIVERMGHDSDRFYFSHGSPIKLDNPRAASGIAGRGQAASEGAAPPMIPAHPPEKDRKTC